MLFGVNTPGAHGTLCWTGGADPPTKRGQGHNFEFWGPPRILGTAAARYLKVCLHIERWGFNENYAKLGHGVWARSRDLIQNFGTPLVSLERLKLET